MQNGLLRKKVNLLSLKLKTTKILQLARSQSASSVKKNMGQMSAGIYKQNVIIVIMLVTLQSFVRRNRLFQGPVRRKSLLRIPKAFFLPSINCHLYRPHLAL